MLFWKDDKHLEFCKFCGHARYKPTRGQNPRHKKTAYAILRYLPITPRLQRLYASNTTVEHMSWHATHETESGVMCHPFDAEAWKYFNETHPDFALEPRNVRLGLCADGFALHGQYGKLYSCWPISITPYNLPPRMCMKSEYMFLSLIIPGPANPKRLIDVYLQPLIEELVQLWLVGAQTCVDLNDLKMHGMKSHDSHVFMERLIPIAFREMLPEFVWSALTKVSLLFQSISSATLDVNKIKELEESVAIIICNLEKIFFPAFFDSMGHLIVHLPYEARVGGPVQYRWMYPFERFLHTLKKKVKNKAVVEASICEAYIVEEISTFATHYFEPDVVCKRRRPGRNDDGLNNESVKHISIFNYPGRPYSASKMRYITGKERHDAETYIIANCSEA
ncbi:UNVERIFIED_CONTAM: hypothetical protein Sradi_0230900 [Sesamum radiatum]|uniref:DUF4218 domain-containing protein n=1 Tax=Sesamum radiatum TaxID=300843 RepID=A0AAW2W226_SESRA